MDSARLTASLAREQGAPLNKEADYKPYMGILKSGQLAQLVSEQFPAKTVAKLLRSDVDFEVTDELVVRVYSRDHDPKLAADVANVVRARSESKRRAARDDEEGPRAAELRHDVVRQPAGEQSPRREPGRAVAACT